MANSKLYGKDERMVSEEEALLFDPKKDIRIIMMGKTGEGKSATCNTIIGQQWFKSESAGRSVTQKGKLGKIKWKGQLFKIVDTPGFFDNIVSEEDLKMEIVKCMTLTCPGPHIILYVIKIGRFTPEDIKVADKFLDIFTGNPYKFVIIVVTGRDDLEYNGTRPEEYLKTVPSEFTAFAHKCGNRYVFVNNRSQNLKDEWIQLHAAIIKLVNKNRSYYTNELYEKLNKALNDERAKKLRVEQNLTDQRAKALLEKDVENEGSTLSTLLKTVGITALFGTLFGSILILVGPATATVAATGAVAGILEPKIRDVLCTMS